MKRIRIGVLSSRRSLVDRTWVKQDIEILTELGFDVQFIPQEGKLLRNLRKLLSCDLLFEWFAYPDAAFYAKIFGRMSILNAVGSEVAYYPEFKYGLAMKAYMRPFIALGLKSADKVIATSRESARWAEFWSKRKSEVIYEGINTDKFKPLGIRRNTNVHALLAVANLERDIVPRKNLSTLVHAMKLVIEQMPNTKLVIAGEKLDGYQPLRLLVEGLKLEDNVVFTGKISDEELLWLYNTSDIFVMPSLQEGFPTVCCEALSCETPVITSNRPSMNEIFTNNIDAILVEPNDQAEIAKQIIRVLTSKKLAKRLGKKGRELVLKNFSRSVRKDKLNKTISEVTEIHKSTVGISLPMLIFYLTSQVFLLSVGFIMRFLPMKKR